MFKFNTNNYKDQIAIVVVGYNRITSITRLLNSLLCAKYPHSVPLVISIDCSGDENLYKYAREFKWPFGEKFVNIQSERLGLKNHILQCGDLTQYFKGIILLEDDIFVSEFFYPYVEQAVDYYYDDERIACISLYRNEFQGLVMLPTLSVQDGYDGFLKQSVASWGQCWTDRMWKSFRDWYDNEDRENFDHVDMPDVVKSWKKAWSKYFISYEIQNDKYCLFPSVSLTTCFCEAGENGKYTTSMGQVTLLSGPKQYHFAQFEDMTIYDIYGNNIALYSWLGLDRKDLCIDMYGYRKNINNCRYILSPFEMPYTKVQSFAMSLRPIELNIKYNIIGDEIHLYDSSHRIESKKSLKLPISYAYYYLRFFNLSLLRRYIINYYRLAIKRKLHRK